MGALRYVVNAETRLSQCTTQMTHGSTLFRLTVGFPATYHRPLPIRYLGPLLSGARPRRIRSIASIGLLADPYAGRDRFDQPPDLNGMRLWR